MKRLLQRHECARDKPMLSSHASERSPRIPRCSNSRKSEEPEAGGARATVTSYLIHWPIPPFFSTRAIVAPVSSHLPS